MFSSEYYEILKNIFLYRTPLVAGSEFLTKLDKNNCKENHFLDLAATFLKITHLQVFRSVCLSLKLVSVIFYQIFISHQMMALQKL